MKTQFNRRWLRVSCWWVTFGHMQTSSIFWGYLHLYTLWGFAWLLVAKLCVVGKLFCLAAVCNLTLLNFIDIIFLWMQFSIILSSALVTWWDNVGHQFADEVSGHTASSTARWTWLCAPAKAETRAATFGLPEMKNNGLSGRRFPLLAAPIVAYDKTSYIYI